MVNGECLRADRQGEWRMAEVEIKDKGDGIGSTM
jgi:hypothetical protein